MIQPTDGEPARTEPSRSPGRAGLVDQSIRIAVVALLLYWSFQILQPFLALIVWAVIVAIISYPAFNWLQERLNGRQALSASLLTLLGIVLIVGPVGLLGQSVASTVEQFYQKLDAGEPVFLPPSDVLGKIPLVGGKMLEIWGTISTNFKDFLITYSEEIKGAGQFLLSKATGIGLDVLVFLCAQLLAGYLLVAGPRLASGARRLLDHMTRGEGDAYADAIVHTVRNVAVGAVGVALLQAVVGGLTMLVFGVTGAGILALLALGLGVVQIGVGAIFTPVAIIGLFTMDPWSAVPMAIILLSLTIIDNYLKPMVMGKGLDTPTLLVFFGLMGGVTLHGFIGVFIGPVVLTVVYRLSKEWLSRSA